MKTSSNSKTVASEKTHSSSEDHKETQEKQQEKCDTESKPETANQKTEEPVQKEEDTQVSKEPGEVEDSNQDSKKSDTKERKKIVKRKPTLNGGYVERVLSEGETSTSYESISSINSSSHFDDFSVGPSDDENLVRNENSACDNLQKSKQKSYYREDKSRDLVKHNSRSEDFLSRSSGRRLADGVGSSGHHESWRKDCEDREYRLHKTDKWLREQENFHNTRDEISPDRASSHCSENRSRRFRSRRHTNERVSPRRSRDRDRHRGVNDSGSLHSRRSSRHRSRRDSRESRSPIYKVRKGAEYSRPISRPRTSSHRDFPNEATTSRSSPTIVWEHLDNSGRRDKFKRSHSRKSSRAFLEEQNRKKEELNNLLTDLKIKLKQARRDLNMSKQNNPNGGGFRPEQGNSSRSDDNQNANNNDNNANKIPVIPPSRNTQNVNPEMMAYTAPQSYAFVINPDDPDMPKMSLDNLPLIPGESGLPIHLTDAGEQIPHDMDGRRIPIGPNGLYLPLDPTGRLFPHIVSPRNQAVPIHISEDGVLRLPNLDPIPVGPLHNLPVNIDGSAIPVGLDSRPLIPCPNLPTEPPVGMMQMAQSHPEYYVQEPNEASFSGVTADVGQAHSQIAQAHGQVAQSHCQEAQAHCQEAQSHCQEAQAQYQVAQAHCEVAHSSTADPSLPSSSGLSSFNQNPREECSTAEQPNKFQKRAFERNEDGCKRKEKDKNLGARHSKGNVKRSLPVKTDSRRASDKSSSDNDMIIDSSDSDSSYEGENVTKWTDVPSVAEVVTFLKENFCGKDDVKDSPPGPEPKEAIIRNVEKAIKALKAKNYKPPAPGRFILPSDEPEIIVEQTPNVSPLLRNRVQLPFITANANPSSSASEPRAASTPVVNFRFLDLRKKSRAKGGKSAGPKPDSSKRASPPKTATPTFDRGTQCDFTTEVISNLSSRISELEMEITHLRNVNANLLDSYRSIQGMSERKKEELEKAVSEIQRRNEEILNLKRIIEKKKSQC